MHLIVVRDDLSGFQHLHPRMSADGSWTTPVTLAEPGSYRVFADFNHDGRNQTLARTVTVAGTAELLPLPAPAARTTTSEGYDVSLSGASRAASPAELEFHVSRDGQDVDVQDYLGAKGHLVALRKGDLAYLHTHPAGETTRFETEFPTEGTYRLFFQFKHDGTVHTAAFTRQIAR
jgi:hypothetical protein